MIPSDNHLKQMLLIFFKITTFAAVLNKNVLIKKGGGTRPCDTLATLSGSEICVGRRCYFLSAPNSGISGEGKPEEISDK